MWDFVWKPMRQKFIWAKHDEAKILWWSYSIRYTVYRTLVFSSEMNDTALYLQNAQHGNSDFCLLPLLVFVNHKNTCRMIFSLSCVFKHFPSHFLRLFVSISSPLLSSHMQHVARGNYAWYSYDVSMISRAEDLMRICSEMYVGFGSLVSYQFTSTTSKYIV